MRPLARAMIQGGLTFPAFVELARRAYVESAEQDFAVDGAPSSHSRIAVLTGVHRKELRRLAGARADEPGPPAALALSAKVVAVWTGERAYLDAAHQPRPLSRTAAAGEPSFEQLVASVSKDVRSRALLDEWLRQGMVADEDGLIRLRRAAFVPAEGYADKAYFFGRNLGDHIAAGAHNLAGGQPPLFDRAVYYDRLQPDSIAALRRLIDAKATALLLEINQAASALAAQDRAKGDGGCRFTLGAYLFTERTVPSTEPDPATDRPPTTRDDG
jgi:hypothetical protein